MVGRLARRLPVLVLPLLAPVTASPVSSLLTDRRACRRCLQVWRVPTLLYARLVWASFMLSLVKLGPADVIPRH